jgi:ATP-binding cassette subfamily F protein 3
VILITHDAHLVELVADRLWLVKDGRVAPYDGDMEDYRRLLLAAPEREGGGASQPSQKKAARQARAGAREALAPLRAELRACEERIEKLDAMLEKLDAMLADPALYEGPAGKIEALQKKRGEIVEAQGRAEALWIAAGEKLEAAEAEAG